MSCTNCGSNALTGCNCQSNCPDQSSQINYDGVLSFITVPANSNINDVLALLELYVANSINGLNLEFELAEANCLGLAGGTYGYNQIIQAIIDKVCSECSISVAITNSGIEEYTATVTGGTAPYTYQWTNKSAFSMYTLAGATTDVLTLTPTFPMETLQVALLEVVVTDANGCTASDTFLAMTTNIVA